MLTIHQTKFGKSRQVPLHPSTVEALRRYRWMRDLAGMSAQDEAPFFVGTRGRRRGMPLSTPASASRLRRACANSWAGATAVLIMPRAFMI